MIVSEPERAVKMLKLTVMGLLAARGMRSVSAIIQLTPLISPPSEPEGTPGLLLSLIVLTLIPDDEPGVAAPIVAPARVTVTGPETMLAELANVKTMLAGPGWPAVSVDGETVGVGDVAMKPDG